MGVLLDEVSEELPEDFFKNLNGGILLLPERKLHKKSIGNSLYVMGEYHMDGSLGRYIAIYYGSFIRVFGSVPKEQLKEELRKTLRHEFRHHLESMAGDKSLEIEDAQDIAMYLGAASQNGRKTDPNRNLKQTP
jgi:hypothetical protein